MTFFWIRKTKKIKDKNVERRQLSWELHVNVWCYKKIVSNDSKQMGLKRQLIVWRFKKQTFSDGVEIGECSSSSPVMNTNQWRDQSSALEFKKKNNALRLYLWQVGPENQNRWQHLRCQMVLSTEEMSVLTVTPSESVNRDWGPDKGQRSFMIAAI